MVVSEEDPEQKANGNALAEPDPEDAVANGSNGAAATTTTTTTTTAEASSKSILLIGEDEDMEDDEDLFDSDPPVPASSSTTTTTTTAASTMSLATAATYGNKKLKLGVAGLPTQILAPSPYPQHNAGPTSSRFRNALSRVTQHPTTDTEAWQVLLQEVQTCHKQLLVTTASSLQHRNNNNNNNNTSVISGYGVDDTDTAAKWAWIESCLGTLLLHFPYAASHVGTAIEMFLAQSARPGEQEEVEGQNGVNGGPQQYQYNPHHVVSPRAQAAEEKATLLLEHYLGFRVADGAPVDNDDDDDDALREKQQDEAKEKDDADNNKGASTSTPPPASAKTVTGLCSWVVELWLYYIRKVQRDAQRHAAVALPAEQRAAYVRQETQRAYKLATEQAGFAPDNHILWKQGLDYIQSWTANADPQQPDHQLVQQQMVATRSMYQRALVHPMTGLDQIWHGYEAFERQQSEALAAALTQEWQPKYQHARSVYLDRQKVYGNQYISAVELTTRLATPPVASRDHFDSDQEYLNKMQDEAHWLASWNQRCAYERTNPERLSPADLQDRVRATYKILACFWTRHPEIWHSWSTWELGRAAITTTAAASANTTAETATPPPTTRHALRVLQTALSHIPTCTLLAHAQASTWERHTTEPSRACHVMDTFLRSSPNSLAFVLYQQMVRRHYGMEAARAVFGRARRVLRNPETMPTGASAGGVGEGEPATSGGGSGAKVVAAGAVAEGGDAAKGGGETDDVVAKATKEEEARRHRWMVTNRLDPSIGGDVSTKRENAGYSTKAANNDGMDTLQFPPGPITWHLYASHAHMEHRINRAPQVAARVYELGLRKHASFLTVPAYVQRYAQLLLELGDGMNLRALLTRAVAACGNMVAVDEDEKKDALAAFWDMSLHFENILGGADPQSVSNLQRIEQRRREVVMGADLEDVATGGPVGGTETALIGAQKSTVAEQLIRTEGYDLSSNIVNGMSRTVNVLEVMGLWGNSDFESGGRQRNKSSTFFQRENIEIRSGGQSDASYQKRLEFQRLRAAGMSSDAMLAEGGVATAGSKMLSARERLQQGGAAGPASAIVLAIQQMPEWIRPLCLMLPATRNRLPIVPKPPPHLTEMALSLLQKTILPAERPADESATGTGGKRKRADRGDGDSSDEEAGGTASGYGNAFRKRQQQRMMTGA